MHCSTRAPVTSIGNGRLYTRRHATPRLRSAAWTRWHELRRELTTRFGENPSVTSDALEGTVENNTSASNAEVPASIRDTSEAEASTSSSFPEIPWNGAKVFEVMVIWLFSFVVISSQMASLIPKLLGLHQHQLSSCAQALGYFLSDVTNLLLTLFILTTSLRPYQFWEMGLFRIKMNWAVLKDVLLACVTFPLIDVVAHRSQAMFQKVPDTMAANLEQSITNGDFTANLVYYFVFSICTPIWEEAIFRGFLLSSLTRYMPLAGAVLASSAVFTAAHFSLERFAYLMLLGCVIGGVFVRTRNLAAPILVHSLWNFYIFLKVAIPKAVL